MNKTKTHNLCIPWQDHHTTIWWNECCAMVLEVFGLPGDKYTYVPLLDHMIFKFKDEKDYFLCRLMLSENLGTMS
jgi:hypothetical protein